MESLHFIEEIVEEDIRHGKHGGRVHTRFPPEPNGYLHIGHAKSICLNYGLSKKYGGKFNLRFDDTNPETEETEYVESILEDVRWLGADWEDRLFYASDYFDQLYGFAQTLIRKGLAYVDDSSAETIAEMKGSPTRPGIESPFRNRSEEENMALFEGMRRGEYAEGSRVLRAKIDMASPNMHFRDPVLYRIKFDPHHRTGTEWKIYPMYDFAHGQSDAIEGITHSICTLEFENHRPLYNWFIEQLGIFPSRQIEFARLNLTYTIMSKRKLIQLVREGIVKGWDDPRMPTICGFRRRGFTPESIWDFCDRIGIARRENSIDVGLLEFSIRDHLNRIAPRAMAVLHPLRVTITNYPEGKTELLPIENNPEDPAAGSREVPFSRSLYIEKEDFMEDPPKKYFRLSPGGMVRLKGAYILRCQEVIKDPVSGEVVELKCQYLPDSKSGEDHSGIKVKGILHWVSALHAVPAEVRLYDRLFTVEEPDADKEKSFLEYINPDSLKVLTDAMVEPSLHEAIPGSRYQFLRNGYFCADYDSRPGKPVFNRTVTLKDTWAKVSGGQE